MNLSFPLSVIHVNQEFGANADYYKTNFGTDGHMGIDFKASHGTPVYAVHDGFAFYVGPDAHGGDGVYLRFQDGENYYTCIYWHLCAKEDPQYAPLVGVPGKQVKRGDVLGYADNSGAPIESSGDHLHFGLAPCDVNGTFLHKDNGFNGCIDPITYFDGSFATDISTPDQIMKVARIANEDVNTNLKTANILYSIVQLIRAWLIG